jgi:hypothetical protein
VIITVDISTHTVGRIGFGGCVVRHICRVLPGHKAAAVLIHSSSSGLSAGTQEQLSSSYLRKPLTIGLLPTFVVDKGNKLLPSFTTNVAQDAELPNPAGRTRKFGVDAIGSFYYINTYKFFFNFLLYIGYSVSVFYIFNEKIFITIIIVKNYKKISRMVKTRSGAGGTVA